MNRHRGERGDLELRTATSLPFRSGFIGLAFGPLAMIAPPVSAQVTQRVNLGVGGAQADDGSNANGSATLVAISADGRFVAFESNATNLVPGDSGMWSDVFVRDRESGTTERVSVGPNGVEGDGESAGPSISADGRFVAFYSFATNLVPGDTNGTWDVFVRDRQNGTTERVSVDTNGNQGNGQSTVASISADGRFVAFSSYAANLVPCCGNGSSEVFLRDRLSGTTQLISTSSTGVVGNWLSAILSETHSITSDGRFIVFYSLSSNLVPGDTNGTGDVFVKDVLTGTTERVNVDSLGNQTNGPNVGGGEISADGRYVVFTSMAANLVSGDTNHTADAFVHDRQTGATERVSVSTAGVEGNSYSDGCSISADGRYVCMRSYATNLVVGDRNGTPDVFVRDRLNGTTERVSLDSEGNQANGYNGYPTMTPDGRFVTFLSVASNLVPGDTNGVDDFFVRELSGGTSFSNVCDAGVGGVISCPCSNPPSGPGQGCDNSVATGGASLSALGGAYLSSDSLVFTTSGERSTATSVLLQGTSLISGGAIYGQGVRCLGGTLERLFVKSAFAGSIRAPDFSAGDETVSARSAAKGDVIGAGQSRWYLVFYRDPVVLGGCPPSSRFNATQTARIDWRP